MAAPDRSLKLAELAHAAGVSPRTVRYYIQRGLLPAPDFRGAETAYGREHLLRLQAIRRLQDQFWPLDAIGRALAQADARWLEDVLAGRVTLPQPDGDPPPIEAPGEARPACPPPTPAGEVWWRVVLAPGVELHLTAEAKVRHAAWLARLEALGPP